MVTTNGGLNRVRDLFTTDLFKAQAGTGTNAPTANDTALQTAVAATLLTVSSSKADKAVQVTHTINPGIADSSALSEQEIQTNSGSTEFNRITHTALTKGANDQFNYITTIFFEAGT